MLSTQGLPRRCLPLAQGEMRAIFTPTLPQGHTTIIRQYTDVQRSVTAVSGFGNL